MLPGNEEFEAFVENKTLEMHVEILQTALYKIYFSSINHIRIHLLETIFKPSLMEENNSKFFYSSFLFLSNISLPNKFSRLRTDNSLNIDRDFFSLNKQNHNYFSRNVIDSYDWELKKTIDDYLKNGFIPVENIELLSKYGGNNEYVELDKLGTSHWQFRKANAKKKINEIADDLIKPAAERSLKKAPKFI